MFGPSCHLRGLKITSIQFWSCTIHTEIPPDTSNFWWYDIVLTLIKNFISHLFWNWGCNSVYSVAVSYPIVLFLPPTHGCNQSSLTLYSGYSCSLPYCFSICVTTFPAIHIFLASWFTCSWLSTISFSLTNRFVFGHFGVFPACCLLIILMDCARPHCLI